MSRFSRRVKKRLQVNACFPRGPLAMERLSWKLETMTDFDKKALDNQTFDQRVEWLKGALNFQP